MASLPANLQAHWVPIAPLFSLQNEGEYDAAVERLNGLVDEIGTNDKHPLYGFLDALGTLVHTYEDQHHVIPQATGPGVLQFLMEEHGLTAADIPEIGSRESVELYLDCSHDLSVNQVRALARRFCISPAAFID
jgi:HTH-type transcriptional regulator / antitoxin HigA